MTTRDEFAKAALTVCARELFTASGGKPALDETGWPWDDYDDMAQSCYHIADAMMRARRGKTRAKRYAMDGRAVKKGKR